MEANDRKVLPWRGVEMRRKVQTHAMNVEQSTNCLRRRRDHIPTAHGSYLRPPAMTRIFGRGTSGGRAGGKSQNRAPYAPLDSSRQGTVSRQSHDQVVKQDFRTVHHS
jgi:hypothetical protein